MLLQNETFRVASKLCTRAKSDTEMGGPISARFKRERSIISNASKHLKRRHVFNVDLQDFFGTINFGRLRGFFIKDKNFALQPL